MVEPLGLGSGVHDLKLGNSFDQGSGVGFHSIRYDFKPASVDTKKMASLNIEEGKSVTVTVPHMAGSGTTHTVYKGNKRPIQKECVLIIDHQTGEITLEKLSNTLQLKKTSCRDALKKKTSGNESGRIRLRESSPSSDISELERRIGGKLDINDKAPTHRKSHHSKSKTKHISSKRHKSNGAPSPQSENITSETMERFCLDSLSKSRHLKTKHSFKRKRRAKHNVPENTRLTCILLSDDEGLPDLDFSPGDLTSSPMSLGEQRSKVAPSDVGPSTNTERSNVACSLILIGEDSNELPDIEMTQTEKTGGDMTEIMKSIKLTNKNGIKAPSCPTVKTERPDVSSRTHQDGKSLVNSSSSTSSRVSPILNGQRVSKEKGKNGYTRHENSNNTKLGHKAQEEQKTRLSQKGLTKTQNPTPTKQIDVVKFAETIKKDILTFLQGHNLEVARRPYVSSSFTLSEFQHSHKTLYDRALKRADLPEQSLNALIKFICREYREFLISSEQLLAHVQRLEDVCDFILARMEQGQKDGGKRKHTALK